jgi:PAS domain S-box-containing protein
MGTAGAMHPTETSGVGGPVSLDVAAEGSPRPCTLEISADGRLVGLDERVFALFGFDAAERDRVVALGQTREARAALVEALLRRMVDAGAFRCVLSPVEGEVCVDELVLRDGRCLERFAVPARGPDGAPGGRLAVFRDVTRRRRAERELRERARQQSALAALGEVAMNVEEVEPLLQAACVTVVEMLGADAALVLVDRGDGGLVVQASAGLPAVAGAEVPAAAGAAPRAGPLPAARGDGVTAAPDSSLGPAAPLLLAHGLRTGATAVLPGRAGTAGLLGAYSRGGRAFPEEDLRFLEAIASVLGAALARHAAEGEVIARERRSRAVLDAALDAMLVADDQGVVVDANPAACALFAQDRWRLLGQSLDRLTGPGRPDAPGLARRWPSLAEARHLAGEAEVPVAGGTRSVEYSAVAHILPGRHLCVLRDVTERRQLHARLALADRMVSVGTLAAGVAHELNNPLAYVNANLGFLAERLAHLGQRWAPGDAELADLLAQAGEAVRDARDGAERMRVIIRDLKTFSRADEDRPAPVELRPVIESCVNMAWNEIKHRARLVKDLAPVPRARGTEARLGQVFLNLLVNAAQAIPEGRADAHEIRIATRPLADGRVAVEIRDTGCGIPPENAGRIFDPFFTTKPPGVGTGLGLSICHSIVAGLGGEILVESAPGKGSTFSVVLQAAPEDVRASPAGRPPLSPRPRGKLLVVDDEPLVGTVVRRALNADHDVTFVQSARAALDRLDGGERFDLVLSDLLMPEMTGMDLYRALQDRHPGLARRMIFLTGGAFTPAAREFLESEAVLCVEKPFELEAIRRVLAARLAEPEAAATVA